jgi:hypothetical protein
MQPTEAESHVRSHDVFEHLLLRSRQTPIEQRERRWHLLEAAHIVGQTRFGPHLKVHMAMLSLAWESKDFPEMAGQLFRIALVPLGHLIGRLPIGNPGRANVSAFKPMQPSAEILHTISESRKA